MTENLTEKSSDEPSSYSQEQELNFLPTIEKQEKKNIFEQAHKKIQHYIDIIKNKQNLNDKDAVALADEFLIDTAEKNKTVEDASTVLIEGALEEISATESSGPNPINIIEKDGFSDLVTQSVEDLAKNEVKLPDGEKVADVVIEHIEQNANTVINTAETEQIEQSINNNEFEVTDKEKIEQQFSPDNLSKLSLENYVNLLKQYPNYMVTHITRQGYRDHANSSNHNAGMGEFQNGFVDILTNDKALKSPLDSRILINEDPAAFIESLGTDPSETAEDVTTHIDLICSPESALNNGQWGGGYLDKKALHLATETVMDGMYGGESSNEIFIAWPSMMIASGYLHSHSRLDYGESSGHNDVWVYGKDGISKDLPIDAGIVFLPKETLVNKETGSKYDKCELPKVPSEGDPEYFDYLMKKAVGEEPGLITELAQNPIASQQYWEKYFSEHPDLKPAHVFYYDDNPTAALQQWREQNNITKTKEDFSDNRFDDDLGFPELRVDGGDAKDAWNGVDEFKQVALQAVDKYFADNTEFKR
ncbi:MAG TPA: hypothetical protein VFD55_02595 [Candidatus Angelobacter sp.]|nr:hypothetical protein [Candidatus Angelobacter sp.]